MSGEDVRSRELPSVGERERERESQAEEVRSCIARVRVSAADARFSVWVIALIALSQSLSMSFSQWLCWI